MGFATYTTSNTTTRYSLSWGNYSASNDNIPQLKLKVQNEVERLFEKGKFFTFESSREFRQWFGGPKTPVRLFRARHGFQQMARIPCYRGVRTR